VLSLQLFIVYMVGNEVSNDDWHAVWMVLKQRGDEVGIRAYTGYPKTVPAFGGEGTQTHFVAAQYHLGRMAPLTSKSVQVNDEILTGSYAACHHQ
jgi:hypothetical protein